MIIKEFRDSGNSLLGIAHKEQFQKAVLHLFLDRILCLHTIIISVKKITELYFYHIMYSDYCFHLYFYIHVCQECCSLCGKNAPIHSNQVVSLVVVSFFTRVPTDKALTVVQDELTADILLYPNR